MRRRSWSTRPPAAPKRRRGLGRLAEAAPLRTLVELFLAAEQVAGARAETALDVEAALALGLLETDGNEVRAPLSVAEWQGRLLAHDHETGALASENVAGISNATRTLAALTVRRPAERALDIGTGSGAQALLAAEHAVSVVATDITDRSLEVAGLNLELNDVANVELRRGSFFEPVEGERFDLIVSNPPFVVSPDSELVFRDGGLARDDISRLVITELTRHLQPGGFASTPVCWAHDDGDWAAPLREWLGGSGCDAFVVRYAAEDPLEYALKWATPGAVERWVGYYEREGLQAVATSGVVLRRKIDGSDGWFEAVDAETGPTGAGSEQLLRIFAARDFAGDLLKERVALAPHTLNERLAWKDGRYEPEHLSVALNEGIGLEVSVEPAALPTLFELNGERALSKLPSADAALPTVRRLFQAGFLEL